MPRVAMPSLATVDLTAHLQVDRQDLTILEMASLNYWSGSLKEFMIDTIHYDMSQGGTLNLGELERRIGRLTDRQLLVAGPQRPSCGQICGEEVAANLARQGRLKTLVGLRNRANTHFYNPWHRFGSLERLRMAIYDNRPDEVEQLGRLESASLLTQLAQGFRLPESFQSVPQTFLESILAAALTPAAWRLADAGPALAFLESLYAKGEEVSARLLAELGEQWMLRGQMGKAQELARQHHGLLGLQGSLDFLGGRYDLAQDHFARGRESHHHGRSPLIRCLDFVCSVRAQSWAAARQCWQGLDQLQPWLVWLASSRQGMAGPQPAHWSDLKDTIGLLFVGLTARWEQDEGLLESLQEPLHQTGQRAQNHGYATLAKAFLDVARGASSPLSGALKSTEGWRGPLQALVNLNTASEPLHQIERLAWFLSDSGYGWHLDPKIQKRSKNGWTSGRSISHHGRLPPETSQTDREAVALARCGQREKVWPLLVGHPRVYREGSPNKPVEIVSARPQLVVTHAKGHFHLQLEPGYYRGGMAIVEDGPCKIRLVRLRGQAEKISSILGQTGLRVPEREMEAVQNLLGSLSAHVAIASDVSVGSSIEEREPERCLYLCLQPHRAGLEVQALVRPLGLGGPTYPAGHGPRAVVTTILGRAVQTIRNLAEEAQNLASLELVGKGPWFYPDPSSSLALLEALGELPPERVQLEWPQGQPFKIKQRASLSDFPLSVAASGDWFEVSAQLTLDDGQVVRIEELLDLLRSSPGRFVALGNGEFLALTEEFRQRLQRMSDVLDIGRGKKLRLHPLAAGFLEDWPGLRADQAFRERLEELRRLEEVRSEIPSTLQAELRDYQQVGFEWLAQRAGWGMGACLADDMGLGKTLQALALLVLRAPQGPALVVAPTSVSGNWMAEAARFAPTLRLHDLRDSDREGVLARLGPFDVVVASYGLLVNEIARLEGIVWQTVILDEAQAIKNSASQRCQAALRLQAEARLATTGTPVENRLDELWSLFRFLNPGLLGSLERFRSRWGVPIEAGDAEKKAGLRRLVHPFLLRRTKAQVLKELPSRTEVTLEIELSKKERAFYEALRLRAVEQLQGEQVEPMAVLAELTRLRRACCHPSLVGKHGAPFVTQAAGSKLEAMLELVEELLEGGHRALIFSQFVDHLSLIRQQLDLHRIDYQYLDGSTPARERTRRVADFQAGQGSVFLISLKAGGVGLNLTGADYVIHMDPWWNPAVEDQASDRAHRIGQQRPVTIYRLVSRHTVEDKIVALHGRKRELAQTLLDGAESTTRLNSAELLRLIRDE